MKIPTLITTLITSGSFAVVASAATIISPIDAARIAIYENETDPSVTRWLGGDNLWFYVEEVNPAGNQSQDWSVSIQHSELGDYDFVIYFRVNSSISSGTLSLEFEKGDFDNDGIDPEYLSVGVNGNLEAVGSDIPHECGSFDTSVFPNYQTGALEAGSLSIVTLSVPETVAPVCSGYTLNANLTLTTVAAASIPEPSSVLLLGLGSLCIATRRRRTN